MAKLPNEVPHNLESEQSVLAAMLLDNDSQTDILSALTTDDFYTDAHRTIYQAMKDLATSNKVIDFVTVTDELERTGKLSQVGGIIYVTELAKIIPSTANYRYYLQIVKRDSLLRKLIRGANDIIEKSLSGSEAEESVSFAEKTIFDITKENDTSTVVAVTDVLPEVVERFDAVTKDKNAFRGASTGYKDLDANLNGVHNTDLMILAARPAVGKTSFALNILENIALADKDRVCLVFSLEMGREQLVQRMLCSVANVSMEDATKGKLDKDKWLRLIAARKEIESSKIFIDDSSLITPVEMLSKCRRIKRKYGRLDFVVIDYLQLMTSGRRGGNDSRQNEVSEVSRSLKILAKEINVPVLALSHLSRANEQQGGRRPQLSDLRESGAIEQDADIVMFIHRPDKTASDKDLLAGTVKKNVAEILIEKHRNGPTGKIELYFRGDCTKFVELNEARQDGLLDAPVKKEEGEEYVPATEEKEREYKRSAPEKVDIDDELFGN